MKNKSWGASVICGNAGWEEDYGHGSVGWSEIPPWSDCHGNPQDFNITETDGRRFVRYSTNSTKLKARLNGKNMINNNRMIIMKTHLLTTWLILQTKSVRNAEFEKTWNNIIFNHITFKNHSNWTKPHKTASDIICWIKSSLYNFPIHSTGFF